MGEREQADMGEGAICDPQLPARRVLVAEDNPINQEIAFAFLTSAGFEVALADDGQAAVDLARAAGPGGFLAGLFDLEMPVLDGLSAMRLLRDALPDMALVAMTGHGGAAERQACAEAGALAHVAKPFDRGALLAALDLALGLAAANAAPPRAAAAMPPASAMHPASAASPAPAAPASPAPAAVAAPDPCPGPGPGPAVPTGASQTAATPAPASVAPASPTGPSPAAATSASASPAGAAPASAVPASLAPPSLAPASPSQPSPTHGAPAPAPSFGAARPQSAAAPSGGVHVPPADAAALSPAPRRPAAHAPRPAADPAQAQSGAPLTAGASAPGPDPRSPAPSALPAPTPAARPAHPPARGLALGRLTCFDAAALLSILGDPSFVARLLLQFRDGEGELGDEIVAALACDDREEASRLVHRLKGVAGNLRAQDVFACATRLEADLDAAAPADRLAEGAVALRTALDRAVCEIDAAREAETARGPAPVAAAAPVAALRRRLRELARLLRDQDLAADDAWEALAPALAARAPEPAARIAAAVAALRYQDARKLAEKLTEALT